MPIHGEQFGKNLISNCTVHPTKSGNYHDDRELSKR